MNEFSANQPPVMGIDSSVHTCPGCGVTVVGHERCGDPTRPECRNVTRSVEIPGGDPVGDWSRLDESPAASAQMIQWYAPETAAALVAARPYLMPTREQIAEALNVAAVSEYRRGGALFIEGTENDFADAVLDSAERYRVVPSERKERPPARTRAEDRKSQTDWSPT